MTNAAKALKELVENYENGIAVVQGIDTVIAGRPNAGKSTLMNLLAGRDKSIVTDIEGTTRDIVEESVRLGGLVLHLSDTAGLRKSKDEVETIGIDRAYNKIEQASLILPVFDSSRKLNKEDMNLIERCRDKKAVAIINKTDLSTKADVEFIQSSFAHCVFISAKSTADTSGIEKEIKSLFAADTFDAAAPILANQRQKQCCVRAMDFIFDAVSSLIMGVTRDAVNVLVDSAIDELLSLTGQKANIEVVNNIFSKFCVGK